jgi:hypothetical protein
MAYTDLFNEAIDDVTATLTAVSGLRVVNDPHKNWRLIACTLTRLTSPRLQETAMSYGSSFQSG